MNRTLRKKTSVKFSQYTKFSFMKMHLKMSYAKLWPFYPGGHGLHKLASKASKLSSFGESTGESTFKERARHMISVSMPWYYHVLLTHLLHYDDVMVSAMASLITSLTIVCVTAYSGGDQREHQSTASLAFVWGIHRWPVNSPHKGTATRKMFPFDDVIMWR